MNDTSGQQSIGGSYANPAGYHLRITNGKPAFRLHDGYLPAVGAREISSVSVLDPSQWYYLTFTCDQTQIMLYVNGVLEGSDTLGSFDFVNQSRLRFGCASWDFIEYFNGMIDDIGIWDRVLTQQEITNLYNGSIPITCSGSNLPIGLSNGLVAWYPFCGNANDESGSGFNGTVNGATLTNDRFGNNDGAYYFNGSSDNIQVHNFTSSPQYFTINLWFSATTDGDPGTWEFLHRCDTISRFNATWNMSWGRQGTSNYLHTILYTTSGNIANLSGSNMGLNNWYMATMSVDSSMKRIYINGVLVDSTSTAGTTIDYTNKNLMSFGFDSQINWFNGTIDDIGIWNRKLTDQEINNLYNSGICYQTVTVTDTLIINAILTGFNPVVYQNAIKVYPNPSNDHITIDCGSNYTTMNGYSLRIDNLLSQTVYTTTITQQSYYIDLNTWTGNGVYLIYLINDQGTPIDVRKIVIQ